MIASDVTNSKRRAVIFTRVAAEYAAVRQHLGNLREEVDSQGVIYEIGSFDSATDVWDIAIAQLGLGGKATLFTAENAIRRYQPSVLLVVGLAAGFKGRVALGDVVVAAQVHSYQAVGDRLLDALSLRKPDVFTCSTRLQQRALHEASGAQWLTRRFDALPASHPRVHVGPVASVESVGLGEVWKHFVEKVLAVDLGSARILQAALDSPSVEATLVLGISDFADQAKSSDERHFAAENASAFAFELLFRLVFLRPENRTAAKRVALNEGYISRISLHNIRSISQSEWRKSKGPGWHVVIGDNGSGKTAILRAIALALLSRRDADALRQDWNKWLTLGHSAGHVELVIAAGAAEPIRRSIYLKVATASPRSVIEEDREGRNTQAETFSVGYGPFRRFSGGEPEDKKQMESWPGLVRYLTLFSEGASLADGLTWLQNLRFKELEPSSASSNQLLADVKLFISESGLLPQGVRISDVSSESVTFIDGNRREIAIQELSDGFRSILSLVIDLLRHLVDVYGPDAIFSRNEPTLVVAPGIVLIDEIDVHLHPIWQHQIGRWFCKHFPKMQFIVTTHSTLICQGADSVYLLPRPGTHDRGRMLKGKTLDRIRYGNVLDAYGTGAFGEGVDRSERSKEMLSRLAVLNIKELHEGLTRDEQEEQARLRATLPTRSNVRSSIDGETVR
jgi:nucleoside phosphorylase